MCGEVVRSAGSLRPHLHHLCFVDNVRSRCSWAVCHCSVDCKCVVILRYFPNRRWLWYAALRLALSVWRFVNTLTICLAGLSHTIRYLLAVSCWYTETPCLPLVGYARCLVQLTFLFNFTFIYLHFVFWRDFLLYLVEIILPPLREM